MILLNLKKDWRAATGILFISLFFSFKVSSQTVEILTSKPTLPGINILCVQPTEQAYNISFSYMGQNGIRLHWIAGNGSRRIVKISPVNSFIAPADGDDPAANSLYNGVGEQVIYNGTDTTILVTGLAPSSNYCFRVYEANCSDSLIVYSTVTGVNNPNCQYTTQGCADYIFTGNGNWTIASNWYLNAIPPSPLPDCSSITINPSGSGECILNVPQLVSQNADFSIIPGKSLVILGYLLITAPPPLPCPAFTLTHTAGTVAPITKTITYGTVFTSISGANKCWITQNLGSNNQAVSPSDASESASGWYWQFNKAQGYKHDGVNRTPNTQWETNLSEPNGWNPANDPCRLLINSSWRLPTNTEWTAADAGWNNYNDTYNSVTKLHAAGSISSNNILNNRGINGYYWSSDLITPSKGLFLNLGSAFSLVDSYTGFKSNGFSLRCIRD